MQATLLLNRERDAMFKIAAILWIILGTTLAGIAITAIVSVPELSDQAAKLIPTLCIGAFVLALPLSVLVARRIAGPAGA